MNPNDVLTRKLSAFGSFEELLTTHPSYRPTILVLPGEPGCEERARLADAYDKAQAERGDARRAFRGSSYRAPAVGDVLHCDAFGARRAARIVKVGPLRIQVEYVTIGRQQRYRRYFRRAALVPVEARRWQIPRLAARKAAR